MPPPRNQKPHAASLSAFTLAEVLITLGIIGVVAALTIPTLIQKHNNHVVETRLKHFYSTFNQAIVMAEATYGDRKDWFEEVGGFNEDGVPNKLLWMQKYFFPYMNILRYEKDGFNTGAIDGHVPIYYLPNGSAFTSINGGYINRDWVFWVGDPGKCKIKNSTRNFGICAFHFFYSPNTNSRYANKGLEPWFDGNSEEELLNSCKNNIYRYGCTALIQINGWKIPKNYPYKVRY